jgi:hypothetical protein
MLFRSRKPAFSITIARDALETIFDECDKFDIDETGGRLIGTYRHENGHYNIQVKGVLESGPQARRSATSFFQDGEHQEKVFRAIEAEHPDIEHLGNWHTHHVNGYPTLSGGDKDTYFRTVNHKMHNTDFFYALLVVSKNGSGNPRYAVKHFVFRRNDPAFYEIPAKKVRLVDAPALLPGNPERPAPSAPSPNQERVKDQDFFSEFYPDIKPLLSKTTGAPYWKGPLSLVNGTSAQVVAMENAEGRVPSYSIATSCDSPDVADTLAQYRDRQFRSARQAVHQLERELNQALYRAKRG